MTHRMPTKGVCMMCNNGSFALSKRDGKWVCPSCCPQCKREAEPGWIELDNNGPIVPCMVCNRNGDYRRADR